MNLYRKKPVVIEAVQWDGMNSYEVLEFIGDFGSKLARYEHDTIFIFTLEGVMAATLGDWIIKGVQGEFYPCKPDIFEATYEIYRYDAATT